MTGPMTYAQAVRRVFMWEFRRFLKLRELITTVVVIVVLGIAVPIAMDLIRGDSRQDLAVVGVAAPLANTDAFSFQSMPEAEALVALAAGEVDGVLRFGATDVVDLMVKRERGWTADLQAHLTNTLLPRRLEEAGVSVEQLVEVTRPVELNVQATGQDQGIGGTVLVSIFLGIMLFAIFTGTGLLFQAITGEKTQRVTELVISAVSPQAWIDGKVYGTIAYVAVNLVTFAVGIGFATVGSLLIAGNGLPALPQLAVDPTIVLLILALVVAGAVLYLFLFAALAASIDDPATSQRSGVIMLPGLLISLGWLGLVGNGGSPLFVFLSYFPLTSSSAMAVRMILGEAGVLEALLALAVLVASCFGARWAAGKVFSLAVLITGKEPSWGEMLRWLRRARA